MYVCIVYLIKHGLYSMKELDVKGLAFLTAYINGTDFLTYVVLRHSVFGQHFKIKFIFLEYNTHNLKSHNY